MPPPRSTTRNTADPLDRVTLVGIAADLADEVGWSKLTLSLVAKRVERHVTSLYAHVDSLEALRREVAMSATDELADQVWKAALARTREDALRAIADVYRSFGQRHPGRAAAIQGIDPRQDAEFRSKAGRLAEPIHATFRSFGLDDRQAWLAHRVFSATVRGLTLGNHAEQLGAGTELDATFEQAVELFTAALASGNWPTPAPTRESAPLVASKARSGGGQETRKRGAQQRGR